MLYEYMGKGNKIYAKCVKKYMGGVPLGSDTRPIFQDPRDPSQNLCPVKSFHTTDR